MDCLSFRTIYLLKIHSETSHLAWDRFVKQPMRLGRLARFSKKNSITISKLSCVELLFIFYGQFNDISCKLINDNILFFQL